MWESNITSIKTVLSGEDRNCPNKQRKLQIEQVGKLVTAAQYMKLYYDGLFDDLMDKYENKPDLFNYMYEVVTTMIFRKNDINIVKAKYQELLRMRSIHEIRLFTYF